MEGRRELKRDFDGEFSAVAVSARQLDRAAVQFRYAAHHRQSQPGTGLALGRAAALVFAEDEVEFIWWYAWAPVFDGKAAHCGFTAFTPHA